MSSLKQSSLILIGIALLVSATQIKNIDILSFHSGKNISGNYTNPTLYCIGNKTECPVNFLPNKIICINLGYNAKTNIWDCQSKISSFYKLNSKIITCELEKDILGIIDNNCILEYNLNRKNTTRSISHILITYLIMIVWCIPSISGVIPYSKTHLYSCILGIYIISSLSKNYRDYISRSFASLEFR